MKRRSLTTWDKAQAALKIEAYEAKLAKERQREEGGDRGKQYSGGESAARAGARGADRADRTPGLQLQPVNQLKTLPFDHKEIVLAPVDRVRNKSSYSSLPVYLCGEQFTLPRLQAVYEAILGEPINKVSFRRKMDELDMLEAVDGALEAGRANRPAQIYRLKSQYRNRLALSGRSMMANVER